MRAIRNYKGEGVILVAGQLNQIAFIGVFAGGDEEFGDGIFAPLCSQSWNSPSADNSSPYLGIRSEELSPLLFSHSILYPFREAAVQDKTHGSKHLVLGPVR